MSDLGLLLGFIVIALLLLSAVVGSAPNRPGLRRFRTQREDDLHDQIQQAMNWTPDMATQRKDGRWFNAHGVEFETMTLDEFLNKHEGKE